MSRVGTDQCTRNVEVGHSVRKKKANDRLKGSGKATKVSSYTIVEEVAMKSDVKDDALSTCENKRECKIRKIEKDNVVVTQSKGEKSQGSDADKIKLVACNRRVKDDGGEKALMDDIEEMEKERKAEKKKRKKEKRERKLLQNCKDDGDEKALMDENEEMEKQRRAEKKNRKMEKERKAEKKMRKKDKRDRMVLSVDKETKVKKKKRKIEKDNGVVTQSKEKKRKRKDIKGDVVAGHEEHNKLKGEHENKKEEVKKRKKNKVLVGHKKAREIDKKKKEKRDHTMLSGDEETEVEKKKSTKKNERDDVEVAGVVEKRVERKTKKMRDDTKARNREKKRERKDIEFEDNVVADLEEQNKLQHEIKKSFSPSDSLKSLIDNAGGFIQGKRFSEEENELLKRAVWEYIKVKKLGKEGLDMVLHCKSHSRLRGCWQEICRALPWRPCSSVYQRARRLFIRGDSKWTTEDVQQLRNSYEKYGPKWKKMADILGKNSCHVRNAFHRYRFGNLNKGKWSQHEYQTLFELVNKDLQVNVLVGKKSCHGMLRDNIKWETISWKIGTRNTTTCCGKWYRQLTSTMVLEGIWADADADADDYKLLMVLDELDASCEEEVEWDNLLEYRSGKVCRKRWLQMVRHLGEHGNKTFSEQVIWCATCRDLAELREDLDARPIVD